MSPKVVGAFIVSGMVIHMDDAKLKTLPRIAECLEGAQKLFCVVTNECDPPPTRFGYDDLTRKEKGLFCGISNGSPDCPGKRSPDLSGSFRTRRRSVWDIRPQTGISSGHRTAGFASSDRG